MATKRILEMEVALYGSQDAEKKHKLLQLLLKARQDYQEDIRIIETYCGNNQWRRLKYKRNHTM